MSDATQLGLLTQMAARKLPHHVIFAQEVTDGGCGLEWPDRPEELGGRPCEKPSQWLVLTLMPDGYDFDEMCAAHLEAYLHEIARVWRGEGADE